MHLLASIGDLATEFEPHLINLVLHVIAHSLKLSFHCFHSAKHIILADVRLLHEGLQAIEALLHSSELATDNNFAHSLDLSGWVVGRWGVVRHDAPWVSWG